MRIATCAFTVIELLVAISIMAIVMGMVSVNMTKRDLKNQSVRMAAEELAATMRKARNLAIESNATFAVVFNIENAPGSTGRILNNRSGGHWYRIVGPAGYQDWFGNCSVDELPPFYAGNRYPPFTIYESSLLQDRSWRDQAHQLPPKKVRFLALTDLDWGPIGRNGNPNSRRSDNTASPTYPRPWFGYYDANQKKLLAWGGWDPAIPQSGFHYWGVKNNASPVPDPRPDGCINQQDRMLDRFAMSPDFTNSVTMIAPLADRLYAKDSPRPLINAAWRDASIEFLRNGEARFGNWLAARHCDTFTGNLGVAERCNGLFAAAGGVDQYLQTEATNFNQATGGWFVTLAPDVLDDNDTFATAKEALDSIYPTYRVFVSRLGDIRVIQLSRSPQEQERQRFPSTVSLSSLGSATFMRDHFPRGVYIESALKDSAGVVLGRPTGMPITRWLTDDMLANRLFWMH